MTLQRREIQKRKSVTRNAPRVLFCAQGNLTIYAWLLSNIYKWRFSSLEPWQNLRRLRLHLRTVWSGDTRSILLQPMGRMERTDSRPRNALIHRESGSPPDYLPTPGSSVSSRAPISVQAAPRFGVFFLRRGDLALRARCVYESTLSYTRAETLLELMQGMFICSEIASVGEKKGEVGSRQKSGSGPVRCDTQDASSRSKSRNESCAGQIWWFRD